MTNIHYLKNHQAKDISQEKIRDEFIDKLYDYLPKNVFYWTLKYAKIRFNQRIKEDAETWLDKLTVYVGLPDWIITEQQIEEDGIAHVKAPLGLINDMTDISDVHLRVAVPFQREDYDTGEAYNSVHHVDTRTFVMESHAMDVSIMDKTEEFAEVKDQYENLVENAVSNVWKKKQLLVTRLRLQNFEHERTETLYTCLTTCMGLAEGSIELIEEFTNIQGAGDIGAEEAKKIYSNLTIEEFFDWSTEHFGLDDYYIDTEVLIDNIKFHIECDESMLEFNKPYIFITKMIARTFPIVEYN